MESSGPKGSSGLAERLVPPAIVQPPGGGALRGITEKFSTALASGTATCSIPLPATPGRTALGLDLALTYDSGAGNGPFGFGWRLSLPSIVRKTDKGLPQYLDAEESDVFVLAGAEDLVPAVRPDGTRVSDVRAVGTRTFRVDAYRPRTEGLFARVERWTDAGTGEVHWRSITRDNVTSLYGATALSRIADPADPRRIFSWLICESRDDRGHAVAYEYVAEDGAGVDAGQAHERNRERTAGRYLRRVRYGNRVPHLVEPDLAAADWLFELVFDYDEGRHEPVPPDPGIPPDAQHRYVRATLDPAAPWTVRPDPFSSFRSGFEIRTYRRCRRVLMFHAFDELGPGPCLVRSLDIDYADLQAAAGTPVDLELQHQGSTPYGSFIRGVTESGYRRMPDGRYLQASLPPLEFEYSRPAIEDVVRELDPGDSLPEGLSAPRFQFVDLDGEGIAGVLHEHEGAWWYRTNLGDGRFAPMRPVASRPSSAALGEGQQLLDVAGDGRLDLVSLAGPMPGFFTRTTDEAWSPFTPFRSWPEIGWDDPNLRFVDLDGDGHADVLVTDQDVFTWYRSCGHDGFEAARAVAPPLDEERGPRLVFADGTQSLHLADMTGDGLADLVRIRNGEVAYWPNLGYGRFGARIVMDAAPWFDAPDQFSQERVRLADLDGSGTTDLIYVGAGGARLYFNQCGNRWSSPRAVPLPQVDSIAGVSVVDLLGSGTACLVWSTPAPADAGRALRYIDLLGGRKPHLLVRIANNLGAETIVRYAPSTRFYLEDRRAGRPWFTRLPFPVQVVDRVETRDRISGNRFVTRYAYHDGCFDGAEREFRGFGIVEQWDTEELPALRPGATAPPTSDATDVPPVHTKTWLHTGTCVERGHGRDSFAGPGPGESGDYYREPGMTDAQARARRLSATVLPAGLSVDDEREACRALRGAMLRQEVYSRDGSDRAGHPLTVVEQNFTVRQVQARGSNRHAVFFVHAREVLACQYERHPEDPRVAHDFTLEVDAVGNVLKEASVAYGRRHPDAGLPPDDRAVQARTTITWTEHGVTNGIEAPDAHRGPLPCESRTFELTGLVLPSGRERFAFDEVLAGGTGATPIGHTDVPTTGAVQKRLVEHVRTLYRRDDLDGPLPLGTIESRALAFESYTLALTPELVASVYGTRVTGPMLADECRYVQMAGDAGWWIPGGQTRLSPDPQDGAAQELAYALQHFFVPMRYRDPFHTAAAGTETTVTYDAYVLLPVQTRDALDNRTTAGGRLPGGDPDPAVPGNDYRVLQPVLVTDPNGNRVAILYDALGLVAATAKMGKPAPAPVEGDSLQGVEADLTGDLVRAYFENPAAHVAGLLGRASTRLVYDVLAYFRTAGALRPLPPVVSTLARETHDTEPTPSGGLRIRQQFVYSDGFGREVQRKSPAEPGPVPRRDASGALIFDAAGRPEPTPGAVAPRWVGTGWTIFNNKGKPVRQYEPFFAETHGFEPDVRIGVSPVLLYDPLDRVVGILHPDHTWEKVVFHPWRHAAWDANDTVLIADPADDPDVGAAFGRLPAANYLPTWFSRRSTGMLGTQEASAAAKAAVHAATPTVTHVDPLGRPFLTVSHNATAYGSDPAGQPPAEHWHRTRTELDIRGLERAVLDPAARMVMRYDYDLAARRIRQASMEAGERWVLHDAAGQPVRTWDARQHELRTEYDALRRPTDSFLRVGGGIEILVGRNVYGESQPGIAGVNLRQRVFQCLDQAGVLTTDDYDFKGNLRRSSRQLAANYRTAIDWSAPVALEPGTYTTLTSHDALDRPILVTAPDGSRLRPEFNEAGLLERLDANLRGEQQLGQAVWTPFVSGVDYDAKGRRTQLTYGNGVVTTYDFDPLTLRLVRLRTRRDGAAYPADCAEPPPAGWPGCGVQDLRYTYDPVGNITHVSDAAQQAIYFRNRRVTADADYAYDALYRLVEATGREHLGQAGSPPEPSGPDDAPRTGLAWSANDGLAMAAYLEQYVYDAAGNLLELRHRGTDPAHPGWTRTFTYGEPSALESLAVSNRLTSAAAGGVTERFAYDAHGNVVRMPHLGGTHPDPNIAWDHLDRLRSADLGGGGVLHCTYDASGRRVRKVCEKGAGLVEERLDFGGFEVFRRRDASGAITLERETLHVADAAQRVALVETRTAGTGGPAREVRFQLGNHAGSSILEIDDQGGIVSYEEYSPWGSTTYQAVRSQTDTPKRYRYTGKERDEETGLYHHGARYYAPWLARWTSCDPVAAANLYIYSLCNPVLLTDPSGAQPELPSDVGPYRTVKGDHVHQVASRTGAPGAKRTSAAEYRGALAKSTKDPAYRDVAGQRVERSINRAAWGRNVQGTPAGPGGTVTVTATGNTAVGVTKPATPSPWLEDTKSFYKLREAGIAPDEAELMVRRSAQQLHDAGATPMRVPDAPRDVPRNLQQGQTLSLEQPTRTDGTPPPDAPDPAKGAPEPNEPKPRPKAGKPASAPAPEPGAPAPTRGARGLEMGGKVLRGAGATLGVAGSFTGGVQVGTGIDRIIEGDTTEGVIDVAEGSANLGLTIGVPAAVKSGALAMEGGLVAGGLTVGAGVAAAGSVLLVAETARAAARGEPTPIDVADKYWGTHFGDIYGWVRGDYRRRK